MKDLALCISVNVQVFNVLSLDKNIFKIKFQSFSEICEKIIVICLDFIFSSMLFY